MTDVKTEYPQQYYASYTSDRVVAVYDAWSDQVDVSALPPAAELIALTAAQFSDASGASRIPVSGSALAYEYRYCATYNNADASPKLVTGWFDIWNMTETSVIASATGVYPLTKSEWYALGGSDGHKPSYGVDASGSLVLIAQTISLTQQAQNALQTARQTVWNEYGSLNEATPDTWVAYLKALMAIANGTDTTSTTLPTEPTT